MSKWNEIQQIVNQVECEPFKFRFDCIQCTRNESIWTDCVDVTHTWYVQATLWRKDTDTGKTGWGSGSKRFISPHATKGEIVKSCFVVARDFAEHEVREAFQYKGRRILGPHIDIDQLWEVANTLEARGGQAVSNQS